MLVENSGRVVSKDYIKGRVWADTFVEDSSLTQNISLLRKALGEGGGKERFIETIPKRGYRFVAPVKLLDIEGTSSTMEEVFIRKRSATQVIGAGGSLIRQVYYYRLNSFRHSLQRPATGLKPQCG